MKNIFRKTACWVLAVCTVLCWVPAAFADAAKISVTDLVAIARHVTGTRPLSASQQAVYDFNGDGAITITDLVAAAKRLTGSDMPPAGGFSVQLTEEQSGALIWQVALPLLEAAGNQGNLRQAPVTVSISGAERPFWEDYILALLQNADAAAVFGRYGEKSFVEGNLNIAEYFPAEKPGFEAYGVAVTAAAVEAYMRDIFGTSKMLTPPPVDGTEVRFSQSRQMYFHWLDNYGIGYKRDEGMPSKLTAENGEITVRLTSRLGFTSPLDVWEIRMHATDAPDSPYGCHITSCTCSYLGRA